MLNKSEDFKERFVLRGCRVVLSEFHHLFQTVVYLEVSKEIHQVIFGTHFGKPWEMPKQACGLSFPYVTTSWNVSRFGTLWSLKWKLIPIWLLSFKLPSLLCFLFKIRGMPYIMNGTLIFLLGAPNNNLGPITLASPPWTYSTFQPPDILVKDLNFPASSL